MRDCYAASQEVMSYHSTTWMSFEDFMLSEAEVRQRGNFGAMRSPFPGRDQSLLTVENQELQHNVNFKKRLMVWLFSQP